MSPTVKKNKIGPTFAKVRVARVHVDSGSSPFGSGCTAHARYGHTDGRKCDLNSGAHYVTLAGKHYCRYVFACLPILFFPYDVATVSA